MQSFEWADPPSQSSFPVAKAGYPFIVAAAFATTITALLGLTVPAIFFLAVTAFVCLFFRDPDRIIPTDKGAVVAPADGKILCVKREDAPPLLDGPSVKVSVFMSLFNVHVNRVPFGGKVTRVAYTPGRFYAADREKASRANENNAVSIELETGQRLCVVQVAGLIARRILCRLSPGDPVARGERFGIICFGSRVDLYLPLDTQVRVRPGDKVRAGTSVIGYLP